MDIQLYPYITITSSLHCCITIMIKYHNQFLHDILVFSTMFHPHYITITIMKSTVAPLKFVS